MPSEWLHRNCSHQSFVMYLSFAILLQCQSVCYFIIDYLSKSEPKQQQHDEKMCVAYVNEWQVLFWVWTNRADRKTEKITRNKWSKERKNVWTPENIKLFYVDMIVYD